MFFQARRSTCTFAGHEKTLHKIDKEKGYNDPIEKGKRWGFDPRDEARS